MSRPCPSWLALAGALLFLGATSAPQAAEISLEPIVTTAGQQPFIVIEGPIEVGDWSRFMKVVRAHPELRGVALESQGGSLDDGLAIAKQIYERGLDTALISSCHSVCSIMFLAGDDKFVPADFRLTVHSAYKELGDWSVRDRAANDTVAWFLGSMGYPLALARLWMNTAPEGAAAITWALNDKWELGFQEIDPLTTLHTAACRAEPGEPLNCD